MAAVSCAPSESANLLVSDQATIQNSFSKRLYRLSNETLMFFVHNSIGYIVMLAVMGYNGFMFLTVILAMGVGYFFFGHISMKINMESIQARTTNLVCATLCPENAVASSKSYRYYQETSSRRLRMSIDTRTASKRRFLLDRS